MKPDPEVTVVLCTLRRPALLERCLDALARQEHPSFEVVVVDNSTGDEQARRAAASVGARYVNEPRTGLNRARNAGARAAGGRLVAYTDDDAVPAPGWLRHHARALDDPSVDVSMGRVLAPPEDERAAAAEFAAAGWDGGAASFRVDRHDPEWFERANFGGIGVGANMAFRRSLFDLGWSFSEHLGPPGLPGEEHHALFTLIRDGHRVQYTPEAVVYHDVPATSEDLDSLRWRMIRGSAAYLTMLILEERGFRRRALRYAAGALHGRRREWRAPGAPAAPFADRRKLLTAAVAGPALYARCRISTTAAAYWPRRRRG